MKLSGIVRDARRRPFARRRACACFCACLALCLSCFLASCATALRVTRGPSVEYRSADGVSIKADYFSLSDGSLSFVKVFLPDGTVLTLPNSVSASGARYTDDREYVWWEKGGAAVLEKRDESGEFRILYSLDMK